MKKVLDAARFAAILCSCESRFGQSAVSEQSVLWSHKALLGARKTTPNVLCLIELGYPKLQDLVKGTHTVYFSSLLNIINQKPMIPRTHFHCIPTWFARSSG